VEELRRRILYEDADLLVINKPAGWPIHGDRHHASDKTLLALALQYLPKSDFQPAFVQRLDKETSGLIVLAKSHSALRSINRQLKLKKLHKRYLALLFGEIGPSGSIRLSLKKQMDRERWLALMVPVRRGGIFAQTDYRRLELLAHREGKFSLVEARPLTGRTHQLRAHFAAVGCPIAGDHLYGEASRNEQLARELGVQRQMLHASLLEFTHPMTDKRVRFEAPLAADFARVLRQLRCLSSAFGIE
jgi:RluA family pseudouridine synthase